MNENTNNLCFIVSSHFSERIECKSWSQNLHEAHKVLSTIKC